MPFPTLYTRMLLNYRVNYYNFFIIHKFIFLILYYRYRSYVFCVQRLWSFTHFVEEKKKYYILVVPTKVYVRVGVLLFCCFLYLSYNYVRSQTPNWQHFRRTNATIQTPLMGLANAVIL